MPTLQSNTVYALELVLIPSHKITWPKCRGRRTKEAACVLLRESDIAMLCLYAGFDGLTAPRDVDARRRVYVDGISAGHLVWEKN